MSYSQRRGFDPINIPIDQVISRDKQATAKKVQQLEGNQAFSANQQQQYLAALGNKHAVEEKNRDTNFQFAEDNRERIHKAETQEFEQRIKDLDKDRHIEDFGEKLIAAIPGIVEVIPQIAGVVQKAQAEKAKAKKDFQKNLIFKTGATSQQLAFLDKNREAMLNGVDDILDQFSKLKTANGQPLSPEDAQNLLRNSTGMKLMDNTIGLDNSLRQLEVKMSDGDLTYIDADGNEQTWGKFETHAKLNHALDYVLNNHLPEGYNNANNYKQLSSFREGIENTEQGKINRQTELNNQATKQEWFLKRMQVASGQESDEAQSSEYSKIIQRQTHDENGIYKAEKAKDFWNNIDKLVTGQQINSRELSNLSNAMVTNSSTGITQTLRQDLGQGPRGKQLENWILKAKKLEYQASYNGERQTAAKQDRLYQAIINPDPNDPEALQQIHALTRPQIIEMVKQRWITQEQANNIISRKGHIGIPERPKQALEPGGVLTKEGSADGVRADLKNRLLYSLIDVAEVSEQDLSQALNFNRSLEQAEALFEYHYEVEKAKPVNKGLDNNSLIEKVFENATFQTRLKSMTPIWKDEEGKALPGHLMKFRPIGLKNTVDPMQIDIDFLDDKFQSAKARGESGVDVVKKGGLMEDDIKQKQLDRIEHIVSSNNQTGLANYDGILASQYIREIAHRAGQSPVWVANEILKSYGRETIQNQDHILDPNELKQFTAQIRNSSHSIQHAVGTNTFYLSPYLQPKPEVQPIQLEPNVQLQSAPIQSYNTFTDKWKPIESITGGTDAQHSGKNFHEHNAFNTWHEAKSFATAATFLGYRVTSTFRPGDPGHHGKGSSNEFYAVDVAPPVDLPYTIEAEQAWQDQFYRDMATYSGKM